MRTIATRTAALLTVAALLVGSVLGLGGLALANTAPAAPAGLQVTPETTNDGTVVLTWETPATAVDSYQIFRTNKSDGKNATYLTFLEGSVTTTYYVDELPAEGEFWYAVVAVKNGVASQPSAWIKATNDLPANGLGTIVPDTTAPAPPTGLNLGADYSATRSLTLNWTALNEIHRFLVFRESNGGAKEFLGYIAGDNNQFTETLQADGTFAYYLQAQDASGNTSPLSAGKVVVVDTVAPVIAISSPAEGQTYTGTVALPITIAVTESGSGYEAGAVTYSLNNTALNTGVIDLANLATGTYTLKVTVTDRAGNAGEKQITFFKGSTGVDAKAPQTITVAPYHKSRTVTVSWTAPLTEGVASYLVYRVTGSTATLAGTTTPAVRTFADTVPADGTYLYYVKAVYAGNESGDSATGTTVVDTVAPAITITAPEHNKTYTVSTPLTVNVSVTDVTSGVAAADIKYFLNNQAHNGTTINLAGLADGQHTFKVEATDRAGNKTVKSVTFKLERDDDSDPAPGTGEDLVKVLTSLQSQISKGHYTALMAFARNGNFKAFEKHVKKFEGKAFSKAVAKQLLDALDGRNSTPGKGKGKDR